MTNYSNIQVGDTLYRDHQVRYGYKQSKWFFKPVKVVKVTKTQFTIEGSLRFKKEDGRGIGNNIDIRQLGDKRNNYSNDLVIDETDAMIKFELTVTAYMSLKDKVDSLQLDRSNLRYVTLEDVAKLNEKFLEFKTLLNDIENRK